MNALTSIERSTQVFQTQTAYNFLSEIFVIRDFFLVIPFSISVNSFLFLI